jgi:hypothetical protein
MSEETPRDQLHSIAAAFAENYKSFLFARITALTASSVIISGHVDKDVNALVRSHPELKALLDVTPQHWDNFTRFTNEMGWVFIVAMLDTFVNDLIMFVATNYPESVLAKQSVSVAVLAKKKPMQIIHEEAEKFLMNAGKHGLLAKIRLLADKIGSPDILIEQEEAAILGALKKRNEIVHRRGARHLYLGWQPQADEAATAHDTALVGTSISFGRFVWRMYSTLVTDFAHLEIETRDEAISKLLNLLDLDKA